MKEIKIRVNTDTGDLRRKAGQAMQFLRDGHQVLVSLQLRGRENAHPERAVWALNSFYADSDISACGNIQREAKVDGKRASLLLVPLKRGKNIDA